MNLTTKNASAFLNVQLNEPSSLARLDSKAKFDAKFDANEELKAKNLGSQYFEKSTSRRKTHEDEEISGFQFRHTQMNNSPYVVV